jgi:tetratricopeptide (TPR) repeat protein
MSHLPPDKRVLHLQPRSISTQRVWEIGKAQPTSVWPDSSKMRLAVLPDEHKNFASLKSILSHLGPFAGPQMRPELAKLNSFLNQVCPEEGSGEDGTIVNFLANSVTFAIMRRISRESVYTARVIDLGARILNGILSKIPNCKSVHVEDVDRLDRPTLKVLTRAMLLLEPTDEFSWVWHLSCDPSNGDMNSADDVFNISRRHLLLQLIQILSPQIIRHDTRGPLAHPQVQPKVATIPNISAALVMQNYDACLLWCNELIRANDTSEVIEGLRLMGLAAVNIGNPAMALEALSRAESLSVRPAQRAHLCYLQGLIDAKRTYDLSSSTGHYLRGMVALDDSGISGGNGQDLALERGWLCNGLALNEAILWRREPGAMERHRKAFNLEQEAFNLVKDGDDPARTYLRFNLLANTAFLLEMQGRYDLAIDLFHKAFDLDVEEVPNLKERWLSTIGYRIGVLHYRASEFDRAYSLLQVAAENDSNAENWSTYERILRALGVVMLELGFSSEAALTFTRGLNICQKARSADGTREHGRGLFAALTMSGQDQKARETYQALKAEEEIEIVSDEEVASGCLSQVRPNPPSPKLPAYIPEIDLEGIPGIDINRFLGKAMPGGPQLVPWSN